ncbi:cyclic di-GMP phosphodiesterase response regulator RpfG [mine drainage metagenome]|uniref:Cyclic di-GMP phosphodiesterase response regulator RpfG n=1 Tax=mine drainage metagenome TaxID=410659 RepID=A0A1J5RHV0_9ZZZZ
MTSEQAESANSSDIQVVVGTLMDLHDRMRGVAALAALTRIAVAVYDQKTDLLRTFIHSSEGDAALTRYVARLSDVPSLAEIAQTGHPRVVDDISCYNGAREHSRRVIEGGFRSSYTLPLLNHGRLSGFLFFNSPEPGFFSPCILHQLWPYAQVAAYIATMELDRIHVIQAAVHTVTRISRERDDETGAHLDRMSRYARMIGECLAESHTLSDEFIEYLFQFAPLHDIGKVAVPDRILLKPGRLDAEEMAEMQKHVDKGRSIIDMMSDSFGLDQVPHIEILRNVVSYHHESWDGSGYPHGLKGGEIPIEARITAVADVFDALTSTRPYKHAWSNQQACDFLQEMSGKKFYPPAVDALLNNPSMVEAIQKQFVETQFD